MGSSSCCVCTYEMKSKSLDLALALVTHFKVECLFSFHRNILMPICLKSYGFVGVWILINMEEDYPEELN